MKITVISSSHSDLQKNCFGTILKFIQDGHKVYLLIVTKKSKNVKTVTALCDFWKKVGTSDISFNNKFDLSSVTQENVRILRSFIEPINPDLAIFPSSLSASKHKSVLGRSSILACRGVPNILMYDKNHTSSFLPKMYSVINNTKMKQKISSHKIHQKHLGSQMTVEVFDTNRILLLNNDIF